MIPESWEPYEREDDGEVLGYLEPVDGDLVRPVTVFGHPLADPGDRHDAARRFEALGLSYLAEPWVLRLEDRPDPVRVRILEARPDRLTLQVFFTEGIYSGERFVLEPPLAPAALTPERPLH
ncbi:hypothetical protein [Naasia aerilata]|uniref:Uncharacterized protein n=1 Tax=Naasia aerilata TaxID=1162966 RepID=A0ABM8G7Q3_9MICO|nr:hypothetical protein [Naasia aerilata]BDZ44205.1 hypothetical protein GCM10025866_01140 [Naasia aerilata]